MKPAMVVAPQSKGKKNAYSNSVQKMTCPYCPRVFPWASSLQRHMLTHTGNTHTPAQDRRQTYNQEKMILKYLSCILACSVCCVS